MSVTNTTASLQSFPKSPLCSLSTTKFNSPYHPSAIVSPIPRFCLISKYNSFCFSAAVVKAASSSHANTKDPMLPPYNVLITGGSKGIGYALAKEFLKAGDNVLICSRSGDFIS
uniref:Short-chain dehydrogenase n=1 Tax=Solanum tuberosum TaxID=4113 RepID=M1AZY0_SOLTU